MDLSIFLMYYNSVMQSDGNSVFGDGVLDSVNMACRDEDNISDKIY